MLFRKRADVGDLAEIPDEKERHSSPIKRTASEELQTRRLRGQKVSKRREQVSTRDTRLQRAEERRNKMKVAKQISEQSIEELDLIETHLAVDEKGCCLRHSAELIRSGTIDKWRKHRFETIYTCPSCEADQQTATTTSSSKQKAAHRQLIVGITGEVKQMHQNKRQWKKTSSQQSSYASGEDEDDAAWKDEAALRVEQVIAWDNDAPLKTNPLYAKYFRMIADGVLLDGIKQACDAEGQDSRLLDFDPDRPLQIQLEESTSLDEAKKAELLYSASGKGNTDDVAESIQILHEAYCNHGPEMTNMTIINQEPQQETKTTTTATSKEEEGEFGSSTKKERAPTPQQTRSAPSLRVPKRPQRNKKKKTKEKARSRINRISLFILGADVNRKTKLERAREELEKLTDELLYTKQLINENNAKGGDMIFQIGDLQKKIEERGKTIMILTDRVEELKEQKRSLNRDDSSDLVSSTSVPSVTGSLGDGDDDDESETETEHFLESLQTDSLAFESIRTSDSLAFGSMHTSSESQPMVSIDDKDEIDKQQNRGSKTKKKRRKRKSSRSKKRRSTESRQANLDPAFLRKTFKERIRKLITINNFFAQASDAAMAKEMNVDLKSARSRQGALVNMVIPEDAEYYYFDEEREFDENEEYAPKPSSSFDRLALMSPALGTGRKMMPKKSSMRNLVPARADSKVKWKNDDQLYSVRLIPGLSKEHFYSLEEIKMFRFEKFMDDNAEEFEIVDEEEWEEEELVEEDEYSYESYEESYYEEDEEVLAEEIEEGEIPPEEAAEVDEQDILQRAEPDLLTTSEQEKMAATEAGRVENEERERLAREEAERLAIEEQERLEQEEAERLAIEEQERLEQEEAERLAVEEQERLDQEEAERLAIEERLAERLAVEKKEKLAAAEEAEHRAIKEAGRLAKDEEDRLAVGEATQAAEEASQRALVEEKALATISGSNSGEKETAAAKEESPQEKTEDTETTHVERSAPRAISIERRSQIQDERDLGSFLEQSPAVVQSAATFKSSSSIADRSVQSTGLILDDLIDQVDAAIKRKSLEQDADPATTQSPRGAATSSRSLPQPSQEKSLTTNDSKESESGLTESEEAEEESLQPTLQEVAETAQHRLLLSLADDQVAELRRTFHAFDTNGSGFVEHDELKANLKLLGYDISEEGFDNLLAQVESKDDKLNFEEFIAWNRLLWKGDMKEKFNKIDADNSGWIDKSQLKSYIVEMGIDFTEEELDDICYEMDSNSDDRIYMDDFLNIMAASRAGNSYCIINGEIYIEKLKSDFRSIDVDNSGFISRSNLQEMASQSHYILSQKELDTIMDDMDRDGDGQISIEDFIATSISIKETSGKKDGPVKTKKIEEDMGERAPTVAPSVSDADAAVEEKEPDKDLKSESADEATNEGEATNEAKDNEEASAAEEKEADEELTPASPQVVANDEVAAAELEDEAKVNAVEEKEADDAVTTESPKDVTTTNAVNETGVSKEEAMSPTDQKTASDAAVAELSQSMKNTESLVATKDQIECEAMGVSSGEDEVPKSPEETKDEILALNIDSDKKDGRERKLERAESSGLDSSVTDGLDESAAKSVATIDDWSSDDEPTESKKTELKAQESNSSLPLISISDKVEADKQAEEEEGEGKKKKRRRRRKRKSDREPNLDPLFLRRTFKQRIRKLITLNRFFDQAADMAMEREFRAEKKSLFQTRRNSSLVGFMQKEELAELEAMYTSDSEFELDGDGEKSMTSFVSGVELPSLASSANYNHTPPKPGLHKTTSVLLTKEKKAERPKRSLRWKSDGEIHYVKFIPQFPDELRTQFFYTAEEMKMFRFEKFMEDNADEYEVVEDEEEWEEEEIEEVSWVSGEESFYDEETIDESLRLDAAASLMGGGGRENASL